MSVLSWIHFKRWAWILGSIFLIVSCSSGQLKHKRLSLSNDSSLSGEGSFYGTDYGKDVFSKYCSGGKQIREMKLNLREITPKAPIGIPVDEAAKLNQEVQAQGSCYIQGTFWFMSHIRACNNDWGHDLYDYEQDKNCYSEDASERGRFTKDSSAQIQSYAKAIKTAGSSSSGSFQSCSLGLGCAMNPTFVISEDAQRTYLLFEPQSGKYWRSENSSKNHYADIGIQKAFISELNILKDQYSMIFPIEFQEKYFGENGHAISSTLNHRCQFGFPKAVKVNLKDQHSRYMDTYASKAQHLGYENSHQECKDGSAGACENVPGPISLQLVAEQREAIWLYYMLAFTSIKEAVQSDPQITDYELSLNLEPFCKYARSINDLISQ